MTSYDPEADGAASYELAIRAAREQCVRRHQIAPRPGDKQESRWAVEGERKPGELDAVKK